MLKKIYKMILICLSSIFAIPLVMLARLIKPIVHFRFERIISSRIGHFGAHSMLCYVNGRKKKTKDYFWLSVVPCNDFLTKLVSRNLNISPWIRYIDFWNKALPFGNDHNNLSPHTDIFDFDLKLLACNERFQFLDIENNEAKAWLRKKGWSEGQKIVCILVRDSAYLEDLNNSYSGHRYRNSDISSYQEAMIWMANQGAFILRMGKKQLKPLDLRHVNVYDYAFAKDKSDFLDIWLFANCDLCISNGTGLDSLSNVYGNPLICVDHLPFESYYTYKVIISYKSLFWESTNKKLNLEEYFQCQEFDHVEKYKNARIRVVNQTSSEITKNVKEGWELFFSKKKMTKTQLIQQEYYWNLFFKYNKKVKKIHPHSLISPIWLSNKIKSKN